MAQNTNGLKSILSSPKVYNLVQNLLGAAATRKIYMNKYFPVKGDDLVLDIGCGTGEILSVLPNTVKYYGYDMSEVYVSYARKKYRGRGYFQVDTVNSALTERLPKFDWVIAIGLIHHLENDDVEELMSVALKALKSDGVFVAVDPCFDSSQSRLANWLISKDRGENIRTEMEYKTLAQSVFGSVKTEVINRVWIPYTHNILICTK